MQADEVEMAARDIEDLIAAGVVEIHLGTLDCDVKRL